MRCGRARVPYVLYCLTRAGSTTSPDVEIWQIFAQHIVSGVDNRSGLIRLRPQAHAGPSPASPMNSMPAAWRVSRRASNFQPLRLVYHSDFNSVYCPYANALSFASFQPTIQERHAPSLFVHSSPLTTIPNGSISAI